MWLVDSVEAAIKVGRGYPAPGKLQEFLVSLAFAPASSPVWRELTASVTHLDTLSGNWSLSFVGAPVVVADGKARASDLGQSLADTLAANEAMHAQVLNGVVEDVSESHRRALDAAGRPDVRAWVYGGGTEIVSLVGHGDEVDWLSLNSVDLDLLGSTPLSRAAAKMRDWQQPTWDAPDYAPGQIFPDEVGPIWRDLLHAGLTLAGSALLSDGITEAARSLLDSVL